MTNTQPAPAPWNTIIQGDRGAQKCRILSSATTIADVYCCGDYNADATARLMAAAPELLEALELAKAHMENPYPAGDDLSHILARAEAVITKARGQSC